MKLLALAAVFALAVSSPVLADDTVARATDHEAAHAVTVRQDGLNLDTDADAAVMLTRLRSASMRACDMPEIDQPGPALRRAIAQCRADAVARAVQELDAPRVTQAYLASAR
ncbi:MAG: UrcA family protein [Hyphomonadaceae bacterium]|nr:UrcA family protein [Hyphomonadaceae bacterium]